jgi:hypothetical protein
VKNAIVRAAGTALLAGALICAGLVPSPASAQAVPTEGVSPAPASSAAVAVRPVALRLAATDDDDGPVDRRLLAVGAGAVAGVVAFNLLTAPLGTVPFVGGVLAAVPESVAVGSRLIAVTTAGAGALAAVWIYDEWTGHQSNYGYLLSLGAGALAGVAVGNLLSIGALGTPPYFVGAGVANGAGVMASAAAQAASRIYVVGSAVIGAWAGDWIYRRQHGSPFQPE